MTGVERLGAQGGTPQQGITYRSPSGTTLRLMLDETNLGSEVSVGEMIFPANQDSGEHAHDAIEIFYVVSGELEHVVNGKSQILKPGMSGFVRPRMTGSDDLLSSSSSGFDGAPRHRGWR